MSAWLIEEPHFAAALILENGEMFGSTDAPPGEAVRAIEEVRSANFRGLESLGN